jgi:hypothetical protein
MAVPIKREEAIVCVKQPRLWSHSPAYPASPCSPWHQYRLAQLDNVSKQCYKSNMRTSKRFPTQIGLRLLPLLSLVALLLSWPVSAVAKVTSGTSDPECANIAARGVERQMNLHASEILVRCGKLPGGHRDRPTPFSSIVGADAFPGSDLDVITGSETYPRVTQAESFVGSHESTLVVAYNDSRGDTESPENYSGVSVSKNGGATFTRLGSSSPFTGHGNNYGDPIVIFNAKLGKWFAGDLAAGCGGQGVGLWTSTTGEAWSVGACAHTGTQDDRESMWVDNNASSPHYGRMYISFNNYAVGSGVIDVVHSDNGTEWSAPVQLTSTFIRDVQLTGSPGSEGTVFLVSQFENGGGVGKTGQQNYMFRSTNGGETWTQTTMGPTFTMPGNTSCGTYFPAVSPIWRGTGWGEPAVGPNGVVMYVYAAHGEGSDESDIFFIRSTNNGETWSAPILLNTDKSGKAQWMPSLRVTSNGIVEASWYDRRNTTNGENYERFARVSYDNGATWGQDEALSNMLIPQPTQPDPKVQACYAGDYNYTTANANTGFDTWTDGRISIEGKPTQKVFFHSIALTHQPTATTEPATNVAEKIATLNGTVNAKGLATKYYFEYGTTTSYGTKTAELSAGSGSANVKENSNIVGLAAGTTYHYRIVATNSEGTAYGGDMAFKTTTWKAGGAFEKSGSVSNRLLGVSCFSASFCASVGRYENELGEILPLALQWNGSAWAFKTAPVPKEETNTQLLGASCPSSTECFAAGAAQHGFATQITLIERFNGTEWKILSSPNPAKAAASIFHGVSCTSTSACIAVGDYANESFVNENLAEVWNGIEWKILPTPNATGATFDELVAVSCTSSSACTAVGNYRNATGHTLSLAERYNGKEWTIQETPTPLEATVTELLGVSCVSSTECYAVGTSHGTGAATPLSEFWNGTKWTIKATPQPIGSKSAELQSISCRSTSECEAVGGSVNSAEKNVTLAEGWNGTEWIVQPTEELSGTFYEFFGVSCGATAKCQGVGAVVNTLGKELGLAEEYA